MSLSTGSPSDRPAASFGSDGNPWAVAEDLVRRPPGAVVDSRPVMTTTVPRCRWCGRELRGHQTLWCSKPCRQTAWRARKLSLLEAADRSLRVAYADPPYPGTARKYYQDRPEYAGEVDHAKLVSLLQPYDGWALSTSAKALRKVLALIPSSVPVRIAPWVKPIGCSSRTRGPDNRWEPVLYVPARLVRPGVRDWLCTHPARGGGTLPGRKPLSFCRWLFALLGMRRGDQLFDLFPGSRIVSRAWAEISRSNTLDLFPMSPMDGDDREAGG